MSECEHYDLRNSITRSARIGKTLGAKLKLFDANAKNALPSLALGVQVKRASGQIIDTLLNIGAIRSETGTDAYFAATNIFGIGGHNVVIEANLRATQGNQFGLFGFGGGRAAPANNHEYNFEPEFNTGVFVAKDIAVGGEYRFNRNLRAPRRSCGGGRSLGRLRASPATIVVMRVFVVALRLVLFAARSHRTACGRRTCLRSPQLHATFIPKSICV